MAGTGVTQAFSACLRPQESKCPVAAVFELRMSREHGLGSPCHESTGKAGRRMPSAPLPVSATDAAPLRPLRVPARLYVPLTLPSRAPAVTNARPTGTVVRVGEPLTDVGTE